MLDANYPPAPLPNLRPVPLTVLCIAHFVRLGQGLLAIPLALLAGTASGSLTTIVVLAAVGLLLELAAITSLWRMRLAALPLYYASLAWQLLLFLVVATLVLPPTATSSSFIRVNLGTNLDLAGIFPMIVTLGIAHHYRSRLT